MGVPQVARLSAILTLGLALCGCGREDSVVSPHTGQEPRALQREADRPPAKARARDQERAAVVIASRNAMRPPLVHAARNMRGR